MGNPMHAAPDDIDITTLWDTLRRSLPRLMLASVAAGALTYLALSMVAPRYTSEAEMEITAKPTQVTNRNQTDSRSDILPAQLDKEAINTHVRALQSSDIGRTIAEKFALAERREFNAKLGSESTMDALLRLVGIGTPRAGESELDRVLSVYRERLDVYALKESRFIGIRFTSSDPSLAAEIANAVVTIYRTRLANQTVDESDAVRDALLPKIDRLKGEVAADETRVREFQRSSDLFVSGQAKTPLNDQQLGELTAELTRAKAALSEASARAESARDLMRGGNANVNADVLRSPLIQNLEQQRVTLESEMSQLSATLLPGHPRMRQVSADLSNLRTQIKIEVGKIVDSLEKESRIAELRVDSIKSDLDNLKTVVVDTSADEAKLAQYEAVVKSKRDELTRLLAQYESSAVRSDPRIVPVEARFLTRATAASVPTFPRKGPFAMLAAVATFLLGFAWTITKGLLFGARSGGRPVARSQPIASLRSYDDARLNTTLASDGSDALPGLTRSGSVEIAPRLTSNGKKFVDVEALGRHLNTQITGQGGKRTLFAGETNAIDAGGEAVNTAMALALTGRNVILVDWSIDGSSVVQKIGLPQEPGLTDVLAGHASFEDVIKQLPDGTLHVIACGRSLDALSADLDADQLNLVLDALDEAYDHIVVVSTYDQARVLFETIEGRFDAGVVVGDVKRRVAIIQDPPGTFLGFEVADIDVVRFERAGLEAKPRQKFVRSASVAEPQARTL